MAVVKIYDQAKQETGEITLPPEVFEVPVRPELLNLVVRSIRASKRAGTHSTLTRSMMKGSGAKPWRQKGTGRARAGSGISPIWTGGAVTFGPQPRDYSFKVNKKVRAMALKMALSSRQLDQKLMVLKAIELPEAKTRHFVSVAKALELGKALVVLPSRDEAVERSARNIPGITVTTADQLNVYSILLHHQIVLLEGAVEPLVARFK